MVTLIKNLGNSTIYITQYQEKNYKKLSINSLMAPNYVYLSAYNEDKTIAFSLEFRFAKLDPHPAAKRAALRKLAYYLKKILKQRKCQEYHFYTDIYNITDINIVRRYLER